MKSRTSPPSRISCSHSHDFSLPSSGGRSAEAVVLTAGVGATVAQLVTVRELMAQFSGNEFVIALNLFVWLAMGALGARLAATRVPRAPLRCARRYAAAALVMAAAPMITLLCIRWLRQRLFLPGVSVGFYPTLGFIALTVAPYSFLTGWLVPRGLAVLRAVRPDSTAARVYILDNIGNVAGGVLFAFVLVWWAKPLAALALSGLPLLAAAVWLLKRCGTHCWTLTAAAAVAATTMLAAAALQTASLELGRGGRLIHYEETRYGRLALYRDQGQMTLFRDGNPTLTTYDPAGAEATVHYPLAIVDRPQTVLLIGGGGGMLAELDKYRLRAVDYVEIDPAAARLQLQFGLMPTTAAVERIHQDGRAFLMATQRRYDAILLSLPEPDTFQLNRFFTERFFGLAAAHLNPGGVFSFSVQGYANYLNELQALKLSILSRTAARRFAHVRLLPGERVFFLCRQDPIPLDIPERLAAKGIDTLYAGPYFYGDIDPPRIAALQSALDPDAPLNTDFFPSLVRVMLAAWFEKFAASPVPFALAVTALGLIYVARLGAAEYVLWTTGALVMGSEILAIFAFQTIYGYIYQQLGLIVTAFLAGLLPGALMAARGRGSDRRILLMADVAMIVLLLIFGVMMARGGQGWPETAFVGFGLGLSLAAGFQFPAAVRRRGSDLTAAAGAFGADLAGAAAGLLAVSVVLIPYLGLFGAAGVLILIKLSSLVAMGGRRWTV